MSGSLGGGVGISSSIFGVNPKKQGLITNQLQDILGF